MSLNINPPTWTERKSSKDRWNTGSVLKFPFFRFQKSAQDCGRCLPVCLIYSACGRIKIRVSGLCCSLGTILQTPVIFHMCKAVWWDVWQPVWPKPGKPYRESPPLRCKLLTHGWLMRYPAGFTLCHPTASGRISYFRVLLFKCCFFHLHHTQLQLELHM